MGGKITTRLDMINADKAKPENPLATPATKQQTNAKINCPELNSVASSIESGKLSITDVGSSGSSTHYGFNTSFSEH